MLAAAYDNWVGLAMGLVVVALVIVALVVPERF